MFSHSESTVNLFNFKHSHIYHITNTKEVRHLVTLKVLLEYVKFIQKPPGPSLVRILMSFPKWFADFTHPLGLFVKYCSYC